MTASGLHSILPKLYWTLIYAQGIAGLILMQPQVPTSSDFSARTVLRAGDPGLLRALPLRSILLNSLIILLTGLILL